MLLCYLGKAVSVPIRVIQSVHLPFLTAVRTVVNRGKRDFKVMETLCVCLCRKMGEFGLMEIQNHHGTTSKLQILLKDFALITSYTCVYPRRKTEGHSHGYMPWVMHSPLFYSKWQHLLLRVFPSVFC